MIELRTFGATQVRPLGSPDRGVYLQPKRLAVLAYLATARPRGMHRRGSLLVVFWPEENEHRGRNALSQTLHAIRRGIGEQVLIARVTSSSGSIRRVSPATRSSSRSAWTAAISRRRCACTAESSCVACCSTTPQASIAGRRRRHGVSSDVRGRPPQHSLMAPKQKET